MIQLLNIVLADFSKNIVVVSTSFGFLTTSGKSADILAELSSLVVCYLIGSIPTAYLVGRFCKGIDIRQYGSGNVGATNAFRVLGKIPGTIVLLVDVLKGTIATTIVGDFFGLEHVWHRVLLAVAVVAGHNWTIFLNFKGGKGIATSLGVLIGLTIKISFLRPILLISVLIWLIIFFMSGFVSLASVVCAVVLPFLMAGFNQPLEMVVLGIIFCIFVVLRHYPNIKRLLSGKESRVDFRFRRKKLS